MRIAYLDTETSHLSTDKAEILEICIIQEVDGQVIDTYHTKIKPDPERMKMANPYALKINGYNADQWADAPTWPQMSRAGDEWRISGRYIDTVTLCREHLPMASVKMDNVRYFFGWSYKNAHTALVDTRQVRKLFHTVYRATVVDRLLWWLVWQYKKNTRPE
jgi:DNA polymerase III epsilon subunit-like protein